MGGGDREGLDPSRQDKHDKVRRMDLIRAFLASLIDGLLSYTHHRDYYRTNYMIFPRSLHSPRFTDKQKLASYLDPRLFVLCGVQIPTTFLHEFYLKRYLRLQRRLKEINEVEQHLTNFKTARAFWKNQLAYNGY